MRRAGVIAISAVALALVPVGAADASSGGRLAYAASSGPSSQVFTVAPRGGSPIQITHDPGGAAHPDWSPDGRSIAYDVGGAWITVAAADGSGERRVTTDISGIDPSWSPDSSRLAFTGVEYDQNGNPENTAIYVTRVDGSFNQRIGGGSQPDWSPTADWIVYRSNPADTDGCPGIWRMHSDGTGNGPVAPATTNAGTCTGGGADPSFSATGKRVVFVASDGRMIETVSIHGGKKQRVFRDARPKASPVFSPDGKRIVYSTSDGLWIVNAKGGRAHRVASGTGYLSWQPPVR
jgi:Tol biopolymer transport system component